MIARWRTIWVRDLMNECFTPCCTAWSIAFFCLYPWRSISNHRGSSALFGRISDGVSSRHGAMISSKDNFCVDTTVVSAFDSCRSMDCDVESGVLESEIHCGGTIRALTKAAARRRRRACSLSFSLDRSIDWIEDTDASVNGRLLFLDKRLALWPLSHCCRCRPYDHQYTGEPSSNSTSYSASTDNMSRNAHRFALRGRQKRCR